MACSCCVKSCRLNVASTSGRSGRKVDSATRGCQATETQQRPKGRNLMESLHSPHSLHSLHSMHRMRSMRLHSMSNMRTRRSLGRTVENKAIQLSKKQSTVTSYVAITVTCCLSIGVPRWLCHTSHNPPSEKYSSLILPPNMPHSTEQSPCTERFHSQSSGVTSNFRLHDATNAYLSKYHGTTMEAARGLVLMELDKQHLDKHI